MKVLFVMEKYVFFDKPEYGMTNNIHNLVGSWEASGLGEYEVVYISPDPGDVWSADAMDRVLQERQYDFAVISPFQGPQGCINCSYGVAERLGPKLAFCWWDCIAFPLRGHFAHPETRTPGWCWWEYADRGCKNLIFDHGKGEVYRNSYGVAVPQDTRIFCKDDSVAEDIDVSFVGAYHTRGDRVQMVDMLKRAGFNVWAGGGRGSPPHHQNVTIEEYAMIHKRSKICLNLQIGHGQPQRKGRTFELGACGKFMLANHQHMFNGVDGQFFEEDTDYAGFSAGDLVAKVTSYLIDEKERKRMATNFYNKYQERYSPPVFWTQVAGMCGVVKTF